jgi:hypothetical protein
MAVCYLAVKLLIIFQTRTGRNSGSSTESPSSGIKDLKRQCRGLGMAGGLIESFFSLLNLHFS